MTYELYIISLLFFSIIFIIIVAVPLTLKQKWLIPSGRSMLFLVFVYTIIFSTLLGGLLPLISDIGLLRLGHITYETKFLVFVSILYSVIVIISLLSLFEWVTFKLFNPKKLKYFSIEETLFLSTNFFKKNQEYLRLSLLITGFCTSYILIKLFLFFNQSPLYYMISGDIVGAAFNRMEVQTGRVSLDLPYISKTINFLIITICLFNYFCYQHSNKFRLLFYISFTSASIYLLFEMQKGPIVLLIFMLLSLKLYMKGVTKGLVLGFIIFGFLGGGLYFLSMGGSSNVSMLLERVFDRILIGQNQSLYYMYQYFEPNLQGVFSDFFFSSSLGLNEIKPDVRVLPYLYDDITHLINANTYFLGEAWSFFGVLGIALSPIVMSVLIFLYWKFFLFLSKYHIIYWFLGFVFFTTLPINQSLQFIVYQKYFLYFVIFGFIPLTIFIKMSRLKVKDVNSKEF